MAILVVQTAKYERNLHLDNRISEPKLKQQKIK